MCERRVWGDSCKAVAFLSTKGIRENKRSGTLLSSRDERGKRARDTVWELFACAQSIARRRQGVKPRRGGPMYKREIRESKNILRAENRDFVVEGEWDIFV